MKKAAADPQADPAPAAARSPRILLVEDDAELRRSIREVFMIYGFAVNAAGDGRDALDLAFHEDYDAVVTDLRLPGLGGVDLAERLRRHPRPPKVFFITAYPHWKVYDDAVRLDVVDVLTKPLNLIALVEIVRAGIQGPPRTA